MYFPKIKNNSKLNWKISNIFFKEPGYQTIIKERYFSQNQQLLRVDNDKIFPVGLPLEKKITKVYFDRGRYKYHGRIKIFAETLRKKGLNF